MVSFSSTILTLRTLFIFPTNAITGPDKVAPERTFLTYPDVALYFENKGLMSTKEYEQCELIILPKTYGYFSFAMGFQKNSPYARIFNHYLKQMRQDGTLDKNLKTYEAAPQVCPDNTGKALGFNNLIFPVFVLILGCLFGLATLMIEKTYQTLISKQQDKPEIEDTENQSNMENIARTIDQDQQPKSMDITEVVELH